MRNRTKSALAALALAMAWPLSPAFAQPIETVDAEPSTPPDETDELISTSDETTDAEPASPPAETTDAELPTPPDEADEPISTSDETADAEPASPADETADAEPALTADETAEAAAPASDAVMRVVNWVTTSGDNGGLPFIVIDKVAAAVFVFDAEAHFVAATPALLGSARGDDSTEGIGDLKLSAIAPDDRTTPAGRFLAGYGQDARQRKVLWVDYATALSLHPVMTADRTEARLDRLISASPEDNRITYGCINISAAFYQNVVRPLFEDTSGVVYILPETRPLDEVFPSLRGPGQPESSPTDDPGRTIKVAESPEPFEVDAVSSAVSEGSEPAPPDDVAESPEAFEADTVGSTDSESSEPAPSDDTDAVVPTAPEERP